MSILHSKYKDITIDHIERPNLLPMKKDSALTYSSIVSITFNTLVLKLFGWSDTILDPTGQQNCDTLD